MKKGKKIHDQIVVEGRVVGDPPRLSAAAPAGGRRKHVRMLGAGRYTLLSRRSFTTRLHTTASLIQPLVDAPSNNGGPVRRLSGPDQRPPAHHSVLGPASR